MLQEVGRDLGARAGASVSLSASLSFLNPEFPYTGENQTARPLATPAPSPAFSAQIGPPLVTYVLPPPGGEGHELS